MFHEEFETDESGESDSGDPCQDTGGGGGIGVDTISDREADLLYDMAGSRCTEVSSQGELTISPQLSSMTKEEETLISEAKTELGVNFDLEHFQLQALLGLIRSSNVVLVVPCGAGKSIVFQLAVLILRKVKNIQDGVGVCLEPLNNILSEKTLDSFSKKSAYLTMCGEDVKRGHSKLSCKVEDLLNGDLLYLYGHPESFMSQNGKYRKGLLGDTL